MKSFAVPLRYHGVISGPALRDPASTQVDAAPDYPAVTTEMGTATQKETRGAMSADA
jgi:hypothetical protein